METLDHSDNSPDPYNISPRNTGLRYGVIIALAAVVMQLVMYVSGLNDGGIMGLLSFAVTLAIMIYGVRFHRDNELGGFISFSRAMGVIFWMGVSSSVITVIWTMVYNNFIDTEAMELVQKELQKMQAQVDDGELDQIVLDTTKWFAEALANPIYLFIFSLISTLFIGLFISLFTKRDNPHHV